MVSKGCCGFDNNIMRAERYGKNITYNSRVFTRRIINNRAYKNNKKATLILRITDILRFLDDIIVMSINYDQ